MNLRAKLAPKSVETVQVEYRARYRDELNQSRKQPDDICTTVSREGYAECYNHKYHTGVHNGFKLSGERHTWGAHRAS